MARRRTSTFANLNARCSRQNNHFGWFAHFAATDNLASSERTRELLGWRPNQPGLIPDLDHARYFKA
jgi:hypothetical protein